MTWEDVYSNAIRRIRYNEAEQTLDVQFHTGNVWRYIMVPPECVERARVQRSWGSWYNQEIKGRYPEFPDLGGQLAAEANK
jgi:hypothetical protein